VVIRCVAELAPHNAHQLAVVERRVELLEVEEIAGDRVGVAVPSPMCGGASVDEAEHAMLEEAACLLANGGTVHSRLPAARRHGFIRQEDAADDLVVALHRVGEAQGQLLKALEGRHGVERPLSLATSDRSR
jgi:hypothetical protein